MIPIIFTVFFIAIIVVFRVCMSEHQIYKLIEIITSVIQIFSLQCHFSAIRDREIQGKVHYRRLPRNGFPTN